VTNPLTRAFTHAEINAMALALLEKGLHPKKVRQALQTKGISWHYQFMHTGPWVGRGERLRRLKKLRQDICGKCDGAKTIGALMCDSCLEKKWAPGAPNPLTRPVE
jgi:hypothetical protein